MAWQWEQNGRVAELIHEGLDFKNRISLARPKPSCDPIPATKALYISYAFGINLHHPFLCGFSRDFAN